MRKLDQSTARTIMVLMVDSADGKTGKTGLTLTITASKNGAAFASISPTVTERGSGWYALALTTSHTDTVGDFALHITATGADDADVLCVVEPVNYDFTISAADSDNVVLPSTYHSGVSLPDDERYEWTALWVVSGTGAGQVVLLSTAGGTVPRSYLIVAGTMPVTLDTTSKCKVLGTWMANSIGVPKRGEALRHTNLDTAETADVVFDDIP